MVRVVAVVLGLIVVLGAAIEARAVDGATCPSRKVKATAKMAEGLLKCHEKAAARGTTADPLCLGKAATKFAASFASADASPPCFATGDAPAIDTAVDVFVDGLVTSLRPSSTASRCASKKLKASGKKTAKRLACHQRAIQQGRKVEPACLDKETDKFSDRVAAAEELPDCLTTGDVGATETAIDLFIDDMVGALRPVPPSICTNRKLIVTGQTGRRKLICHAQAAADGLAVDADCLADLEAEFFEDFLQAEGVPDCFTTGDAAAVDALVDALVTIVELQLRPSPAPSHCNAVKLALSGRAFERLVDCRAAAVRDGVPLIPGCVAAGDAQVTEGFPQQEEDDNDCLTTGDAATVLSTITAVVSSVESALVP
jgi:hypothetical protein